MYGMTECKRVAVMPADRTDKVMAGSCGLPLDGVKVWLVNKEEETGIGELAVEGPNVMEGYWGIRDEDSGVFESDRETGRRRVYTGDLFRIDSEGFLYFCGRRNGIIKIRGYRVNGFRIEEVIRKVAGVKEAAVTGRLIRLPESTPQIFSMQTMPQSGAQWKRRYVGCPFIFRIQKFSYFIHHFRETGTEKQI